MKDPIFSHARLWQFSHDIFLKIGCPENEACAATDVLLSADLRGIDSHGIARLSGYVRLWEAQRVNSRPDIRIVHESPSTAVVDGDRGLGLVVAPRAMAIAIEKAKICGTGWVAVRNSNHFGIAGYYAKMALPQDMLGIAMTNTAALGVPTFGRQVMFGTNPLAFAAPADKEQAFVLDMSTTVVTRGKIEVYERLGKELPEGWAVDKTGRPAANARSMLEDMQNRVGGGILPLGGLGKEFSGHKGYGLAVMVDILCAVLCGAPFGADVYDTASSSARVSHFLGAIKIGCFRDPQEFRRDMDKMLAELRNCSPAEGEERVYFAGLPEFEKEQESLRLGVPLLRKTYTELGQIGNEFGVEAPPPR
jgi:L-2-hydroxycarboxylate dehydrogenase (NAD+)